MQQSANIDYANPNPSFPNQLVMNDDTGISNAPYNEAGYALKRRNSFDTLTLSQSFTIQENQAKRIKALSDRTGIASHHLLSILQKARDKGVIIIFRPVNPETKVKFYDLSGEGKGIDIKLKSANYGPLRGLIPYDYDLCKDPQNPHLPSYQNLVDDSFQNYETYVAQINARLQRGEGAEALNRELKDQNFTVKTEYKIEDNEHQEVTLQYLTKDGKAFLGADDKPIYFYEKQEGEKKVRYYYKAEPNPDDSYEKNPELDAKFSGREFSQKPVELMSYRSLSIDLATKNINTNDNIIIPDYDLYTIGYKLEFSNPAEKLKAIIDGFKTTTTAQFGEISQSELSLVKDLKQETDGMVRHAPELHNHNPELVAGDFVFFLPKEKPTSPPSQSLFCECISALSGCLSSFATTEPPKVVETDIGKIGIANERGEVMENIASARKEGYDVEIGARWGFTFDRKSGEVKYSQEKRDVWQGLYKQEKNSIENLNNFVKKVALNLNRFLTEEQVGKLNIDNEGFDDNQRKEIFLGFLKEKFDHENKFIKNLFDIESFTDVNFTFRNDSTISSKTNEKSALDQLQCLDIIYQYEEILKLQLAPKFKSQNNQEKSQSKEFEGLLKQEIDKRTNIITGDIAKYHQSIKETYQENSVLKDIISDLKIADKVKGAQISLSPPSSSPQPTII